MERRNAWLSYKEAEETEMEKLAKAYREFLDKGKTERECVAEIVKEAEAAGYESLESKLEKGEKIKAGDKVYAVGMKKIVALFHVGTEELSGGMSILCAHIDSPRLDVKQNPLYEDTDLPFLHRSLPSHLLPEKYPCPACRCSLWQRSVWSPFR